MTMQYTFKKLVCAIGLSAVSLTPIALTATSISLLAVDAAEAKNGNGNGGGNGGGRSNDRGSRDNARGGRDNDRNNRGGSQRGRSQQEARVQNTPVARSNNGNGNRQSQTTSQLTEPEVDVPEDEVVYEPRNRGAIASELKGLNAANANPNALANASPNSQVGRIATYQQAALANLDAEVAIDEASGRLYDAEDALGEQIASYDGRSSEEIRNDIGNLDADSADYQQQLDALNTELDLAEQQEAAVSALIDDVFDAEIALEDAQARGEGLQEAEDDAFLQASNGRTISDPAMDYFRELLGLPAKTE